MPGLNGTGPMGMGSMTGRGMGLCGTGESNIADRRNMSLGLGRGFGLRRGRGFRRGLGFGRGLGYGYGVDMGYFPDQESEQIFLERSKKDLENRLEYIKKQLSDFEQKEE